MVMNPAISLVRPPYILSFVFFFVLLHKIIIKKSRFLMPKYLNQINYHNLNEKCIAIMIITILMAIYCKRKLTSSHRAIFSHLGSLHLLTLCCIIPWFVT